MYSYFVSYNHSNGFGQIEILRNQEIKSYQDIKDVRECIQKKFTDNKSLVVIINYVLICKTEEVKNES